MGALICSPAHHPPSTHPKLVLYFLLSNSRIAHSFPLSPRYFLLVSGPLPLPSSPFPGSPRIYHYRTFAISIGEEDLGLPVTILAQIGLYTSGNLLLKARKRELQVNIQVQNS